MINNEFIFSSESVTEGHPDKVADQISDAVLDLHLTEDPNARVACETLIKTGLIVVAGEITSNAINLDYEKRIREVVNEIGYDHSSKGFDGNTCAIMLSIGGQSSDIAQGVDRAEKEEQEKEIDKQIKREIDDGIIAMPDAGEFTREVK